MEKLNFLKTEFPKLLQSLKPDAKGNWGVLNGQQMVEHMSDSIRMATGLENTQLHTPVEKVASFKSYAMSDKEFKPNTKNALMSETPLAVRNASMKESINELEHENCSFYFLF